MKQKILPVLCIILSAALLLSLAALVIVKSEAAAADRQVQDLTAQIQTLQEENQALRLQTSLQNATWHPAENAPGAAEEAYCTLVIDTWTADEGKLTVSAFAQAVLPTATKFSAQVELLHNDAVLSSHPIMLDIGEAEGFFEAEGNFEFDISALPDGEELQLWLIVEPAGGDLLSASGGSWMQENGRLTFIVG